MVTYWTLDYLGQTGGPTELRKNGIYELEITDLPQNETLRVAAFVYVPAWPSAFQFLGQRYQSYGIGPTQLEDVSLWYGFIGDVFEFTTPKSDGFGGIDNEPLAPIRENLFTSGREFLLLANGQEYIGDYHEHPVHGFMTGKKYQYPSKPKLEFVPNNRRNVVFGDPNELNAVDGENEAQTELEDETLAPPVEITMAEFLDNIANSITENTAAFTTSNTSAFSSDALIEANVGLTLDMESLYREYSAKGIFFKSNIEEINLRDNRGNVIIDIEEDNNDTEQTEQTIITSNNAVSNYWK